MEREIAEVIDNLRSIFRCTVNKVLAGSLSLCLPLHRYLVLESSPILDVPLACPLSPLPWSPMVGSRCIVPPPFHPGYPVFHITRCPALICVLCLWTPSCGDLPQIPRNSMQRIPPDSLLGWSQVSPGTVSGWHLAGSTSVCSRGQQNPARAATHYLEMVAAGKHEALGLSRTTRESHLLYFSIFIPSAISPHSKKYLLYGLYCHLLVGM